MPRLADLRGKRFGRLTVGETIKTSHSGRVLRRCLCDCGNFVDVHTSHLTSGHSTSCGCFKREKFYALITKHGHIVGGKKPKEYLIWVEMHARCRNAGHPQFHNYGGRGIGVCRRWKNYENFISDMGARPEGKLTIERVNNELNYSPKNCVWADRLAQANNTTRNVHLKFNGMRLTVSQWSREVGISRNALGLRLKRGWSVKEALTTPLGLRRKAA